MTFDECEACVAHAPSVLARLAVSLMWRAGLRASEAANAQVQDIDNTGDEPALRVREGKGGKTRLVPLHQELRGLIAMYINATGKKTGPIVQIGGKPVTRETITRWAKAAYNDAVDAGQARPGKKVSAHTYRHSAARHWLANGIPINVVQRWLGHSDMATTLRYLEILPDPMGLIGRVP